MEYRKAFIEAEQTFLYQIIYDPKDRKLAPLTPYPQNLNPSLMPFAGHYMDGKIAFQLALGNLDEETLEQLDMYTPDVDVAKQNDSFLQTNLSIWSKDFIIQQDSSSALIEPDVLKIVSNNGKQTTTGIEYSILQVDEQGPTDINSNKSPSNRTKSKSFSILGERKRKRAENSALSKNQASSWSDFRSDPSVEKFENEKLSNVILSSFNHCAEPVLGGKEWTMGDFLETPVQGSHHIISTRENAQPENKTFTDELEVPIAFPIRSNKAT